MAKTKHKIMKIFVGIPLLLFSCFVGYAVLMQLVTGQASIYRGDSIATREWSVYSLAENPCFYWLTIGVWVLVLALIGYAFLRIVKLK